MKKILLVLAMLAGSFAAFAQWNEDVSENTLIATSIGNSSYVSATSDGGVFFSYGKKSGQTINKYLQFMDESGYKKFGEEGMLICEENTSEVYVNQQMLLTDRDDNAIIVVCDSRLGKGTMSYTVYKVSANGEKLWGEEGVTFGRGSLLDCAFMNMIELNDGSLVFSWTIIDTARTAHIEMERLSADGEFLWSAPVVIGDRRSLNLYSWLIPSTDNKFNVVYTQNNHYDYAVRQYNADGTQAWDEDVVIYDGGFDNQPVYTFSDFVSDGEGGVFAGWRYTLDPTTSGGFKSQVAYVKVDGSYGFGRSEKGGLPLDNMNNSNTMVKLAYSEVDDCLYACYYEVTANDIERLVIQKIDKQGNLLYGNGERNLALIQPFIRLYDMMITDDGDVLVVYAYAKDDGDAFCAMRLNAENGKEMWSKELDISLRKSSKANVAMTESIKGDHSIVSWSDGSPLTGSDLYAQPIYFNGAHSELDDVAVSAGEDMTVAIVDGMLSVKVALAAADYIKIDVYNALGVHVACLSDENVEAGVYEYSASLEPGVYVVRIATSEWVASTKVM